MKQMKMRSCICTEPKKMIAMELLQEIFLISCPGNIFTGIWKDGVGLKQNKFITCFPPFFRKKKTLILAQVQNVKITFKDGSYFQRVVCCGRLPMTWTWSWIES